MCADPGCPVGTVYVGSGAFSQGCDAADSDCVASAQPLHTTLMDHAMCISMTELSVAQYRACTKAGRCPQSSALRCTADLATWTDAPGANESLPMTCLLWSEAEAACRFQGGRLDVYKRQGLTRCGVGCSGSTGRRSLYRGGRWSLNRSRLWHLDGGCLLYTSRCV